METLRLYHITNKFLGNTVDLIPSIPGLSASTIKEDRTTPRICCGLSVLHCVRSKELPFDGVVQVGKAKYFYAYTADVPVGAIHQPSLREVPDVWSTNEFWVTETTQFSFAGQYVIREHMSVSDIYSRFAVTYCGMISDPTLEYDEVVDRVTAHSIYGDPEAFSFIEMNAIKAAKVLE